MNYFEKAVAARRTPWVVDASFLPPEFAKSYPGRTRPNGPRILRDGKEYVNTDGLDYFIHSYKPSVCCYQEPFVSYVVYPQ